MIRVKSGVKKPKTVQIRRRTGTRWTAAEERILRERREIGQHYSTIALFLDRTDLSCRLHVFNMKKKKKKKTAALCGSAPCATATTTLPSRPLEAQPPQHAAAAPSAPAPAGRYQHLLLPRPAGMPVAAAGPALANEGLRLAPMDASRQTRDLGLAPFWPMTAMDALAWAAEQDRQREEEQAKRQ